MDETKSEKKKLISTAGLEALHLAAFSLLSPRRKTNTNIRKLYSIDIDNIRKPQMV